MICIPFLGHDEWVPSAARMHAFMNALICISSMLSKHAFPLPMLLLIQLVHTKQRWWDPEWRRQELARRGAEEGSSRQELDLSAMELRVRALKDSRDQDELQVSLRPKCSAPHGSGRALH